MVRQYAWITTPLKFAKSWVVLRQLPVPRATKTKPATMELAKIICVLLTVRPAVLLGAMFAAMLMMSVGEMAMTWVVQFVVVLRAMRVPPLTNVAELLLIKVEAFIAMLAYASFALPQETAFSGVGSNPSLLGWPDVVSAKHEICSYDLSFIFGVR